MVLVFFVWFSSTWGLSADRIDTGSGLGAYSGAEPWTPVQDARLTRLVAGRDRDATHFDEATWSSIALAMGPGRSATDVKRRWYAKSKALQ